MQTGGVDPAYIPVPLWSDPERRTEKDSLGGWPRSIQEFKVFGKYTTTAGYWDLAQEMRGDNNNDNAKLDRIFRWPRMPIVVLSQARLRLSYQLRSVSCVPQLIALVVLQRGSRSYVDVV